jgi:glycosyltransferase involved in cell wall biosynthesis
VQIVMISPFYPATSGPVEAPAMRSRAIASGLHELGHDVSVIVGMADGREPAPVDGVEIVATSWPELRRVRTARGLRWPESVKPGEPARLPLLRSLVSSVLPERYAAWVPGAVAATRRVARPDAVILSTSARSAHIAGRLAHGSRPWIADVNDPWAFSPAVARRRGRDRLEWWMERATVGRATRITTTSPSTNEELARRHGVPATLVLSGFDPREFEERRVAARARDRPRVVLFAGTFYWTFDLRPLYEALRAGIDEGWLAADSLRVSFVGHLTGRAAREAAEYGLADLVDVSGAVPRDTLLDRLVEADALLLPFQDRYTMAMKFFEYVGAGRTIVGFGPSDCPPARLIEEHGLGVVVQDRDGFAGMIRRLVEDPDGLPAPTDQARALFTWGHSIEKLGALVDEVGSSL